MPSLTAPSRAARPRQQAGGVASYGDLKRRVQDVLLRGQARIEQEKVRTYWETGKLIQRHLLANKDRAGYGEKVIPKLSQDLEIDESVLKRVVKFYNTFPKGAARHQLTWAHYRALITIPDEQTRLEFADRAERGDWTSRELAQKVKAEVWEESARASASRLRTYDEPAPYGVSTSLLKAPALNAKPDGNSHFRGRALKAPALSAKLGTLYTYRLIQPEMVHHGEEGQLFVDLGFAVSRNAFDIVSSPAGFSLNQHGEVRGPMKPLSSPRRRGSSRATQDELKPNDIIEVQKTEAGEYKITKSDRSETELFTYQAKVERVVDGDTLRVKIDLGFDTWVRQYLRLRGIDCPELHTAEGGKAKRFVEKQLEKVPYILLTSTRSDKYDRYLADVFIPAKAAVEGKPSTYLNQRLLNEKLAERV